MITETLKADDLIERHSGNAGIAVDLLLKIANSSTAQPAMVSYLIEKRDFLKMDMTYGWLSRTGLFYTCGYGAHEMVLDAMGLFCNEVEDAGWCRVSGFHNEPSYTQGKYIPTAAQRRVLSKIGAMDYLEDSDSAVWLRVRPPEDIRVFDEYER
jgi:hypothetical protein